jgi:hypothetical protein
MEEFAKLSGGPAKAGGWVHDADKKDQLISPGQ